MDLDHVALATRDVAAPLEVLVGELGGTILSGGQSVGFRPMQVRLGDAARGMTVELLEPWDVAANDFLARFLARHGDGPHHLTVKVDDFDDALERVAATGRTPVGISRADPMWFEAFVIPAEACGTVVQLAWQETSMSFDDRFAAVLAEGPMAAPAWWPPPPAAATDAVALQRVVLRAPELREARDLFVGLLGGWEEAVGEDHLDLVWPGGSRLRLEACAGPAGIDRLELEGPQPDRVVAGTPFVGT